jgi:hypothetical protein
MLHCLSCAKIATINRQAQLFVMKEQSQICMQSFNLKKYSTVNLENMHTEFTFFIYVIVHNLKMANVNLV